MKKFARWLLLHQPRRGSLGDIHALDGYLTGIVAGPQAVMPSTWIHDMPPAYRPLLGIHPQLSGRRDPLVAWCQGFMVATELRQAKWAKLLRRKDATAWLQPIRDCAEGDNNTAAPIDLSTLKSTVLNFCAQRAK